MSQSAVIRQRINTLIARELQHPEGNEMSITMELSDIIRRYGADQVLQGLKDPLKHQPPHVQLRALGTLNALISSSGPIFSVALSDESWAERLYKIAKTTESTAVRDRIMLMVTQWCQLYSTAGFRFLIDRFKESKTLGAPYQQVIALNQSLLQGRGSFQGEGSSQARAVRTSAIPVATRGSDVQPSRRSRDALTAIETLIMEAQTDHATLEYSLEHPDMLDPHVAEDCRRHCRKVDNLLRSHPDLGDDIKTQLLVLLEELKEKLEIYEVIYETTALERTEQVPAEGGADSEDDDEVKRQRIQRQIQNAPASASQRAVQQIQADAGTIRLLEEERKETASLRADLEEKLRKIEELHEKLKDAKKKNSKAVEYVNALTEDLQRQKDETETWKTRAAASEEKMAQPPPPPPPPQIVTVYQEKKRIVDKIIIRRVTGNLQSLKSNFRGLRDDAKEIRKEVEVYVAQVSSSMVHIVSAAERERASDVKALKWVQELYKKEQRLRKQYYNTIQELKGNIRVYCRVRPMSETELAHRHHDITSYPEEDELRIVDDKEKIRSFEFDAVFSPGTSQEKVFEDTSPLIDSVIDGFNVCIFAYGQTGSGKTFTMDGPDGNRGINRRALSRLFGIIDERRDSEDSTVTVSVLEIYNESIRDLLVTPAQAAKTSYEIRTNGAYGHYVANLTETQVYSPEEISGILDRAGAYRHQGKTDMNLHSSRSHMILYIIVKTRNKGTGVESYGKLSLVDLAGSERLDKSGSEGQAAKEAACINKSLSALGDVIAGLSSSAKHVPFRNSTLTFLLQDSMQGQAKVLMFACVSPASYNTSETLSTVQFATRARGVSLGAAKKNIVRSS